MLSEWEISHDGLFQTSRQAESIRVRTCAVSREWADDWMLRDKQAVRDLAHRMVFWGWYGRLVRRVQVDQHRVVFVWWLYPIHRGPA